MRLKTAILLAASMAATPSARAAGPVETSPYAVQGVAMDEHDVSAAAAKDKALFQVQMQALVMLGQKLGGESASLALARMDKHQVLPLLKSISIESETISPGHYEGTFTVRFLPGRVKPVLENLGVNLPDEQAAPMLVVPVWTDESGKTLLWEDNPWRKAWQNLHSSQGAVPVIVALGDSDDQALIGSADVVANNVVKLEALRRRYDVKTMLIAYGQVAQGGGIHANVTGTSPLGKITVDKIYTADNHQLADSAALAAQRFQQLISEKFHTDQARAAAAKAEAAGPQQMPVLVAFNAPSQWNGLRSRILATPGVVGLDVTSLDITGATAKLVFTGSMDDLSNSLQASGLKLARGAAGWVVAPL